MDGLAIIPDRQIEERTDQRQALDRRVQSEPTVERLLRQGRIGQPDRPRAVTAQPGDRIAQMMFVPVVRPRFEVVSEFSAETTRGAGGFGSTGGQ